MLYDEAVKQMDHGLEMLALNAGEKRDPARIEQAGKALVKTQEIITELMVSLNFEQGGDIAKNLFALYTWFKQELLESNISQEPGRLINVRNMLNDLRGAWAEAAKTIAADEMDNPVAGVNIAG
jgi:flagellar protein FliS